MLQANFERNSAGHSTRVSNGRRTTGTTTSPAALSTTRTRDSHPEPNPETIAKYTGWTLSGITILSWLGKVPGLAYYKWIFEKWGFNVIVKLVLVLSPNRTRLSMMCLFAGKMRLWLYTCFQNVVRLSVWLENLSFKGYKLLSIRPLSPCHYSNMYWRFVIQCFPSQI